MLLLSFLPSILFFLSIFLKPSDLLSFPPSFFFSVGSFYHCSCSFPFSPVFPVLSSFLPSSFSSHPSLIILSFSLSIPFFLLSVFSLSSFPLFLLHTLCLHVLSSVCYFYYFISFLYSITLSSHQSFANLSICPALLFHY